MDVEEASMMKTSIGEQDGLDLIQSLKNLEGAIPYDGDGSIQVVFKLADGKTLRFGVTDDDVAAVPGLWVDQYEELNIVGGDPQLRDDKLPIDKDTIQLLIKNLTRVRHTQRLLKLQTIDFQVGVSNQANPDTRRTNREAKPGTS